MTREQKMFEAANKFLACFSADQFKIILKHACYHPSNIKYFSNQFIALEQAVSAYEGVAFSDGGEQ